MYWNSRKKRIGREFFDKFKNNWILHKILSVRYSELSFIYTWLKCLNSRVLLDVACGAGKPNLKTYVEKIYGIDIPGFPEQLAQKRGYITFTYEPPDYNINLPDKVDTILCANLNAHVDFETFSKILNNAFQLYNNSKGWLLLILEVDNDNIVYRIFKKSHLKYKSYIKRMQHDHFLYEIDFIEKLIGKFPELYLIHREPLIIFPPFSHFIDFAFGRLPSTSLFYHMLVLPDVIISFINNFYIHKNKSCLDNQAFQVGYVFEVKI